MGGQHSVYVSDDDLEEMIERYSEDPFSSKSELFRKALENFFDDYKKEIEELRSSDDTGGEINSDVLT